MVKEMKLFYQYSAWAKTEIFLVHGDAPVPYAVHIHDGKVDEMLAKGLTCNELFDGVSDEINEERDSLLEIGWNMDGEVKMLERYKEPVQEALSVRITRPSNCLLSISGSRDVGV